MADPLIERSWHEWKEDVRSHWGRVTEEDWQRIEADRERLLLALQERYSWTREEAVRELDDFVSTRTRLIEVERLREDPAVREESDDRAASDAAIDNGVRAQPGDVLGLDTDGETTSLGDTSEDEDRRRVDAERAAPRDA